MVKAVAEFDGKLFLSTLSLRRATVVFSDGSINDEISIHALLAESDHHLPAFVNRFIIFLSTLSLRRATLLPWPESRSKSFLSTLSLRRATSGMAGYTKTRTISIHALLAESDAIATKAITTPAISIHALLAESDRPLSAGTPCASHFYPRSPCGERRLSACLCF